MSAFDDPEEDTNYEIPAARHTQFLDLTNGEGGYYNPDRAALSTTTLGNAMVSTDAIAAALAGPASGMTTSSSLLPTVPTISAAANTTRRIGNTTMGTINTTTTNNNNNNNTMNSSNNNNSSNVQVGGRGTGGSVVAIAAAPPKASSSSAGRSTMSTSTVVVPIDPNTPGKVVEAGHEHTGRWTKEEHDAFLSALSMYGKEWKKVAAKVRTRTVVQTRTHAQKYFQKLQKANEKGEFGNTSVATGADRQVAMHMEMGLPQSAKKGVATKKKTRSGHTRAERSQSTTAAAHLMTNLSSVGGSNSNNNSNDDVASSSTNNNGHGFGSAASSYGASHGFSSGSFFSQAGNNNNNTRASEWGTSNIGVTKKKRDPPPSMSITAPDPSVSMQRGFPEPSPAACGKRKLAELAAAQMLAGVAGSYSHHDSTRAATPPPPPPATNPVSSVPTPPTPASQPQGTSQVSSAPRRGLTLQIINPESLGVVPPTSKRTRGAGDSPVTPWDGQLEALV